MFTFENLYRRYQEYFIYKHGQAKFNTVRDKILNSSKITKITNESIQRQVAPTEADWSAVINTIGYFMFSGSETVALAEFIAIKQWDDKVNSIHKLISQPNLFLKGEAILKRWRIRL